MSQPQYTEITVVGRDKTGLIARITTLLFERGINIEDLDQAVREGLFRMTMRVDATAMSSTKAELRDALSALGDDLGVDIEVRFPADRQTQRIAVLATKRSHCLEALFDARVSGGIDAEIAVVIANHSDLESLADQYGVPFYDVGDEKGTPDESRILELLEEFDADLIVLARYMRILSPNVVFRYEDRIINVHPSLLPAFPGAGFYRQAIEKGVRIAGSTAHYVTTDLDQGPIIAQRAFDVPDDATVDDLRERGQPLEAEVLVEAVRAHLADAITTHRGRTRLRDPDSEGDYQLGLPDVVSEVNPDRPVDRFERVERSEADD